MSDCWIREEDGRLRRVDVRTWASWFETANRTIAVDRVGDARISTVFLGLDHAYDVGPPLIFETMIFGESHALDQEQWRYATREEALEGHARAVEIVRLEQAYVDS